MKTQSKKTEKKDPYEFIYVKHLKCGMIWSVTRNSLAILWCPQCKTNKGFVEVKNDNKHKTK